MKDAQLIAKQWVLSPRLDPDLLTHLLKLRGIDDRDRFLTPRYPEDLHDPFLMKGMRETVECLKQAIERQEVIGVFADYDTDGIPGAALFIDGLRQLGVKTVCYIPNRREGYGLSEQGLRALQTAGVRIVVTIDVGITARQVAFWAREQGIDLIITDHHTVQDELFPTAAFAVVNPKQPTCPYPFKELCGGGVIWKVLCALLNNLEESESSLLRGRNPEAIRRWALDLAAISTICDMVPLTGENRVIASFGLQVLRKTRRPGLQALVVVGDTRPEDVTATTVGFQIGPRINAPGRLDAEHDRHPEAPGPQCSLPLALLLTDSLERAAHLAQELQMMNQERQTQLEVILTEAEARVVAEGLHEKKLIFLVGEDWPPGIVGLVAGRLMERFGRPTIVLGLTGDEAVGSARSIDGLHLVEALKAASHHIKKFGGHTKAAGLTIERQYLTVAYEALLAYVNRELTDEAIGPRLLLDAELSPDDLTQTTARQIGILAPHGIGNHRPLFLLSNAQIESFRRVGGSGQHAKVRLRIGSGGPFIDGIGFGLADRLAELSDDMPLEFAVRLEMNEWQGKHELQLQLADFRLSANSATTLT